MTLMTSSTVCLLGRRSSSADASAKYPGFQFEKGLSNEKDLNRLEEMSKAISDKALPVLKDRICGRVLVSVRRRFRIQSPINSKSSTSRLGGTNETVIGMMLYDLLGFISHFVVQSELTESYLKPVDELQYV